MINSNNIPRIIKGMYMVLEMPHSNKNIYWSEDGTKFYVRSHEWLLSKLVEYGYTRAKNTSSLKKIINNYKFTRVNIEAPEGKRNEQWAFYQNDFFIRGRTELLNQICRKGALESSEGQDLTIELDPDELTQIEFIGFSDIGSDSEDY